tara:strand:+ start:18989 stop:19327 length:339 start_codon:yes stop_codon:yes gene_type:complete
MTAARYDLVIDQGSDFALEFTVSESGTVKDLTGYSARAQIRPTKASSTLSATFTCTVPVGTDGKILMSLSNAITNAVSAGTYQYDLEIFTSSDAVVQKLLQGSVTLNQGVTR